MLEITLKQSVDTAKTNDSESKGMILDYSTKFNIPVRGAKGNLSKIVGTLCNEVFHKMDYFKAMGTKYINCSSPVHVVFKCGGHVLDTSDTGLVNMFGKDISLKLKLGYKAKAKRVFAQRLYLTIQEMLRAVEGKEHDTIVQEQLAEEAKELVK